MPFLKRIIVKPELEVKHGRAIAALGVIGDGQALSSLQAYVDSAKGEIRLARFEAMLIAQSAIGLLARHNDRALAYLLERASVEFWDKKPWTFTRAGQRRSILMVRAVMNGLGLSGRETAREKLEELKNSDVRWQECALDNIALNLQMTSDKAARDGLAGRKIELSCAEKSASLTNRSAIGVDLLSPSVVQVITISHHVNTVIDQDNIEGSLVEASNLLRKSDFRGDIPCDVGFSLDGNVMDFGARNDPDDFIMCPSQLRRVLCQTGPRIKLVTSIVGTDLCETTGFGGFAGCAEEPGMNIIMGNPMTGSVLAHEFGHNEGIHHRDGRDDPERRAIMNPTASGTDGVNTDECNGFRKK